jgi:hypothetical protein
LVSASKNNEEEKDQNLEEPLDDLIYGNGNSRNSGGSSSCNDSMKSSLNSVGGLSILSLEPLGFIE